MRSRRHLSEIHFDTSTFPSSVEILCEQGSCEMCSLVQNKFTYSNNESLSRCLHKTKRAQPMPHKQINKNLNMWGTSFNSRTRWQLCLDGGRDGACLCVFADCVFGLLRGQAHMFHGHSNQKNWRDLPSQNKLYRTVLARALFRARCRSTSLSQPLSSTQVCGEFSHLTHHRLSGRITNNGYNA